MNTQLSLKHIKEAEQHLKSIIHETPLEYNSRLSKLYEAEVYLKREDLQAVRSYKIRGAYNKMASLSEAKRSKGVICASAGNHAQGVAFSCTKLGIKGTIYMPLNTPRQKIERVKYFGKEWIDLVLYGDTFDAAKEEALQVACTSDKTFVHPFDDTLVIAGQATVATEIIHQLPQMPDCIVGPIGGGGLMSGVGFYIKNISKSIKLIGIEPAGAASMKRAFDEGGPTPLLTIDGFIDGAAVKEVGQLSYELCHQYLDQLLSVSEGQVCMEMIDLYQNDGIVSEPAGALAIAGLKKIRTQIKGKTVVCIISGGNNDLARYPEIIERSLAYQGLRHYFLIEFSQRPGALRHYLDEALGDNDDIILFEYVKKNNRDFGPALVGIELGKSRDYQTVLERMREIGLSFEVLEQNSYLHRFLV